MLDDSARARVLDIVLPQISSTLAKSPILTAFHNAFVVFPTPLSMYCGWNTISLGDNLLLRLDVLRIDLRQPSTLNPKCAAPTLSPTLLLNSSCELVFPTITIHNAHDLSESEAQPKSRHPLTATQLFSSRHTQMVLYEPGRSATVSYSNLYSFGDDCTSGASFQSCVANSHQ